MLSYALRRILSVIPIMLGIALISSMLYYIIPGDMVRVMLGQHVDPYLYANVRKALGLDIPFWQNCAGFITDVIGGELGFSFIQQRPVTQIVMEALPVTLKLTVFSFGIILSVGLPLGITAAVWDRSLVGRAANMAAILGISIPSYLLALFFQLLFGVTLKWLPVSGNSQGLLGYILPALAVGLPLAAFYARVARASMLDLLSREHVLFAVSRGIPQWRVILNYALRNALVPVITQMGMDFGFFVTGAVLTETIFNLPGMGRLVYAAINTRDFPLLRGLLLLFTLTVVAVNLLVDLVYAKIDPRMAREIVRETDGSRQRHWPVK